MIEKSLMKVNETSIFYKIKSFFKNLFYKNKNIDEFNTIKNDIKDENNNFKESFLEQVQNIENDETKLIKLQRQYRIGEIKEEELTKEQINSLCALYDKQIANLKKSNQIRKQKLMEYRKLKSNN